MFQSLCGLVCVIERIKGDLIQSPLYYMIKAFKNLNVGAHAVSVSLGKSRHSHFVGYNTTKKGSGIKKKKQSAKLPCHLFALLHSDEIHRLMHKHRPCDWT